MAVKTLQSQKEISFDLYLWPSKNKPPRLYREKNVPLEPGDLQRLLDESVTTLYTRSSEAQQYCDHVRSHVLADETIPAEGALLHPQGRHARHLDGFAGKRGRRRRGEGHRRLGAGHGQPDLQPEEHLPRPACGDDARLLHVYAHHQCLQPVRSCSPRPTASTTAGNSWRSPRALLHDVGKCCIPAKVLNKTTPLTNDEQELIRRHPRARFRGTLFADGSQLGTAHDGLPAPRAHDGRGYPAGLVGKEIHEWARLCAVVDVYDALTARPRVSQRGKYARTCWNTWTASRAVALTRKSANVGSAR